MVEKNERYQSWKKLAESSPIPSEILSQLESLPNSPIVGQDSSLRIDERMMDVGSWYILPWTYEDLKGQNEIVVVLNYVEGKSLFASQFPMLCPPSFGCNKYAIERKVSIPRG